jgi:hypothetical protein
MSGTADLLFGLVFNGAITGVIVVVTIFLARKENRERKTQLENWVSETEAIRRAS